ncbi:MAG TPA: hypothetical protein VE991_10885 [Acidimicrobiales bacterium]|nr:hypothetical protein [Acidimicrobiales bacterium]
MSRRDTLPGAEPGLVELIRSDWREAQEFYCGHAVTHLFPNVYVAVTYRLAHALERRRLRPLAYLLALVCQVLTGAEIRPGATVGPGLLVVHPHGIVIGPDVVAGRGLWLFGKNTLGRTRNPAHPYGGSPVVGDDVHVGTGACLLGPVKVGDDVEIGALSVVVEDVPDGGRTRAGATIVSGPRPVGGDDGGEPVQGE